ncbi:MAG: hypothetical protein V2I50_08830 [Desulfuromusa sp.]|jgi:hypothetical protein|nr:hypothetical protein [Desulfuromusa sp.]
MKTTLAILIAGLIFLATPMLASAHGVQSEKQSHHKQWVKNDRYNHNSHYDHNGYRWQNRYETKRNHQKKNHLRKELRKTRHELHQVKRQIKHNRQRPHYAKPVVVLGVPHLVFQFGW